MFFNRGHRDKKLIDYFISADEIDPEFFEKNHERYLGQAVEWRMCTHMSNGKEGYLCKVHQPVRPEVIERMTNDARDAKKRAKDEANRLYFERLHANWRRQQEEHQQSQLEERYRREQERTNLTIPTLQLPPSYRHSQRDYDVSWDEEEQSWASPPISNHSPGFDRFTRSTPATPVSPRDSYWHNPLEPKRPFSPVSPISTRDYSSLMDQYQQRPSSSMAVHQERSIGSRRPKSAIDLGQPSTAQALLGISRGTYSWI